MKRLKDVFRSCLNPKFLIIAGAVLIAVFIFFPPLRSLAIGYGLLLLLCPLGMFFAMRLMMNTGSQQGMGHVVESTSTAGAHRPEAPPTQDERLAVLQTQVVELEKQIAALKREPEEISAANGAAAPHTAERMNPAAQPAETPYLLKKGEESL
ncbi:DUF2933 domain-containing protein [Candidatus Acetothermia bacterium]|nr:DUF2933 domain-containing protein [Candidatus Acetothermia bacterium]